MINGMIARFVRRDVRLYEHSRCRWCGTGRGNGCEPTTCLACSTTQCMGNGLGRGQCAVCTYGLLPGWSGTDRTCGYAGCCKKAVVGSAPRMGNVCRAHLDRPKMKLGGVAISILDYISIALTERSKKWVEVKEPADLPTGGYVEPYRFAFSPDRSAL